MIRLPDSTICNVVLAKDRIYKGQKNASALQELFTNEVEKIKIIRKLSPSTLNLEATPEVPELYIVDVVLKGETIDKRIYEAISLAAPNRIMLFLFHSPSSVVTVIGYRIPDTRKYRFFSLTWDNEESIKLDFDSHSLAHLYLSLLQQISGRSFTSDGTADVKAALQKDDERQKLEREIHSLESRLKNELQANIRYQISGELRQANERLARLNS